MESCGRGGRDASGKEVLLPLAHRSTRLPGRGLCRDTLRPCSAAPHRRALMGPHLPRQDEASGAITLLHTVHLDRGVGWEGAERLLAVHESGGSAEEPAGLDPRSPMGLDERSPAKPDRCSPAGLSKPLKIESLGGQAGKHPQQPGAAASPDAQAARAGAGMDRKVVAEGAAAGVMDLTGSPTCSACNGGPQGGRRGGGPCS